MAPRPEPTTSATGTEAARAAPTARTTVSELFPRHIQVLAGLPGEVSQFEETGFGYEWRCEYHIGDIPGPGGAGRSALQLHFSLMDMQGRDRPAAVLYLVEEEAGQDRTQRRLLPLEDLADAQESLNAELARRGASVGTLENADRFLRQLALLREATEQEVDWAASAA